MEEDFFSVCLVKVIFKYFALAVPILQMVLDITGVDCFPLVRSRKLNLDLVFLHIFVNDLSDYTFVNGGHLRNRLPWINPQRLDLSYFKLNSFAFLD